MPNDLDKAPTPRLTSVAHSSKKSPGAPPGTPGRTLQRPQCLADFFFPAALLELVVQGFPCTSMHVDSAWSPPEKATRTAWLKEKTFKFESRKA